jgi:hypothetical protein
MDLPRVTLTGDRAGAYVVVEERPDGSLVLAVDPAASSAAEALGSGSAGSRSPGHGLAALLSRRRREPATIHEALDDWGVKLHADEFVAEFVTAEVDGRKGFLAVTNQRLIFFARTGGELRVVDEHPLWAIRGVALVRRGLRTKLHVSFNDGETIVDTSDDRALARLQRHLTPH